MKLYRKENMIAQYQVEPDWEEFEDELVMTDIGERLLSETKTQKFQNELEKSKLYELRDAREQECFSVINRGGLWYDTLTDEQKEELKVWYKAWLDVTETKIVPEKPNWLK